MAEPHDVGMKAGAAISDNPLPDQFNVSNLSTSVPSVAQGLGARGPPPLPNVHTTMEFPTPSSHPGSTGPMPGINDGSDGQPPFPILGVSAASATVPVQSMPPSLLHGHGVQANLMQQQPPRPRPENKRHARFDIATNRVLEVLVKSYPDAQRIPLGYEVLKILSKLVARIIIRTQKQPLFLKQAAKFLSGQMDGRQVLDAYAVADPQQPLTPEQSQALLEKFNRYRAGLSAFLSQLAKIRMQEDTRLSKFATNESKHSVPQQYSVPQQPSVPQRPTQPLPRTVKSEGALPPPIQKSQSLTVNKKATNKKSMEKPEKPGVEFASSVYGGALKVEEADMLATCAVREDEEEEKLLDYNSHPSSEYHLVEPDWWVIEDRPFREFLCCIVARELGVRGKIQDEVTRYIAHATKDILTTVLKHLSLTATNGDTAIVLREARAKLLPAVALAALERLNSAGRNNDRGSAPARKRARIVQDSHPTGNSQSSAASRGYRRTVTRRDHFMCVEQLNPRHPLVSQHALYRKHLGLQKDSGRAVS